MIDIVGRLPSEHMLCALGQHTLESHCSHLSTDVVAIDKRRVAQDSRTLAKVVLHLVGLLLHVGSKRLLICQ